MRTWILLVAVLWLLPGVAAARQAAPGPAPNLKALKGRTLPDFVLKKSTPTAAGGVVEVWERAADGAQLRIEVIPKATPALAETRLKAVNAKIGNQGQQAEELMFRYASSGQNLGWTNYRATHHITFKTYRYWALQRGTLLTADLSFPRGKPNSDTARRAFVTAKKSADGTLKALGLL